jgi:MYXO-CTERM domain-containing protein
MRALQTLDFPIGQWVQVQCYLKQAGVAGAAAYSGQIRCWQNGEKLFDETNVATKYGDDVDGTRLCHGDDEWSFNAYSDGVQQDPAFLYADDAVISTAWIPLDASATSPDAAISDAGSPDDAVSSIPLDASSASADAAVVSADGTFQSPDAGPDAGAIHSTSGGCGCGAAPSGAGSAIAIASIVLLGMVRRRANMQNTP